MAGARQDKYFYLQGPATFGLLEWEDNATGVEDEEQEGETVVQHPYDPSKNNISTKMMTMDLLIRRLNHNEIDLMPDFQRGANLWSDERMSRLIESLLIRLPLPVFYFDASDDSRWLVVDGLQRLSAVRRFVVAKDLRLKNLEYLEIHNKKGFDELPRDMQRRIEETQVTAHLIQPGTPLEVKYNIFRRINTGGLILTAQEIRHALNPGKAAKFLERLARSESFLQATAKAISPSRMLDREFVLRFVAFYVTPYKNYVIQNMDNFLTEQMRDLNKTSDDRIAELESAFETAMSSARQLFGKHAFRKRFAMHDRTKPINKALFEAWSVGLARLSEPERMALVARADCVQKTLLDVMTDDNDFVQSITQGTGDPIRVRKRFSTVEHVIQEALSERC